MRSPARAITAIVVPVAALAVAGPVLAALAGSRQADANLFLELDLPSLAAARDAVQAALEGRETGEAQRWQVSGVAEGAVTPLRTWRTRSGHWCREYEEFLRLASGASQVTTAIRCRSGDGVWRAPDR